MKVESDVVRIRTSDCVSALQMVETLLPALMMSLIRSTVTITDASEAQYQKMGVVEDVTLCGIRQRQGSVGYVGLSTAAFYVLVRTGRDRLRRYRMDQLELNAPSAKGLH